MRFSNLSALLLLLVVSDITTVAQDADYKPEHGVECGVGGENSISSASPSRQVLTTFQS
jgi:hypothetical protein